MTVREISSLDDLEPEDLNGRFVVIEESPIYPGQLVLLAGDQDQFRRSFSDFVSRYHILKELSLLEAFIHELETQGYNAFILPSGRRVIVQDAEHKLPLCVAGFALPNDGKLFSYQQYGISKALALVNDQGFCFFNWGTGSGKSIAAAAGAQELILNRKEYDLALVFTLRKIKGGLARAFETTTQLRTRIIDGTKDYRTREYAKADADVYVMNYEKAHHDQRDLQLLIKGKRVLFVFDEVSANPDLVRWESHFGRQGHQRSGQEAQEAGCLAHVRLDHQIHDPARYWRVFQWAPEHPLGHVPQEIKYQRQCTQGGRGVPRGNPLHQGQVGREEV